jgi:hypothetical protein
MPSILNATTSSGLVTSADNSGSLQLATNNGTTAVTIDTSQNVGIGTSSPSQRLSVVSTASEVAQFKTNQTNTDVYLTASGTTADGYVRLRGTGDSMVFITGLNERMRIDSSGNLLVGTTSSIGGKISSVNAGDAIAGQVLSNNNFSTFLGKNLSGTSTFYVSGTGQITAAFTTINSTSDQRLKENITNLDVGLDAIMALKPRKFDWKKGKGKDIKGDRGFVAQEFEQVFPDLVGTSKYDVLEDEEPYKTISVDLIPVLVKAIQEQQAMLAELKATVEAQAAEIALLKSK